MKQTIAALSLAMAAAATPTVTEANFHSAPANGATITDARFHSAPAAGKLEQSGQAPFIIQMMEEMPAEQRSAKFDASLAEMRGICDELGLEGPLADCVGQLPQEAPEGMLLAGEQDPHYEYTHPYFTAVLNALHEAQENGGQYGEYIAAIATEICGAPLPDPDAAGQKIEVAPEI